MPNWERKNAWSTKTNGVEMRKLWNLVKERQARLGKSGFKVTHIDGHSGNPGNDAADALAVKGAEMKQDTPTKPKGTKKMELECDE